MGPRSGFARMVVYARPEVLGAVVAEAQRRAQEKGVVVREALDLWMKRSK